MNSEGEATHVVSTTPKSYGSIREARRSCSYVEAAWEDDFASSVSNERSLNDMRTTFLGKGIVATTIMMFFGVVVTLAHSQWAKGGLFPGEGARSGLRDLPGTTLEVYTARFAMIRLLCSWIARSSYKDIRDLLWACHCFEIGVRPRGIFTDYLEYLSDVLEQELTKRLVGDPRGSKRTTRLKPGQF